MSHCRSYFIEIKGGHFDPKTVRSETISNTTKDVAVKQFIASLPIETRWDSIWVDGELYTGPKDPPTGRKPDNNAFLALELQVPLMRLLRSCVKRGERSSFVEDAIKARICQICRIPAQTLDYFLRTLSKPKVSDLSASVLRDIRKNFPIERNDSEHLQ